MGSSEEGEGEGEGSHLMDDHEKPPSRRTSLPRAVPVAGLAVLVLVAWFSYGGSAPEKGTLRVATWNIAAINNNPFEYWITHDDADYNALMEGVQSFIDQPGERDVPVSEVFTPAMWAELKALMTAQGWGGVEETEAMWQASFGQRKIISGFMKDRSLGEKRLASMPDRVTNTINLAGGRGVANRPTVINCFAGDMTSRERWWASWKAFMFERKVMIEGGGKRAPLGNKAGVATLPASQPAEDQEGQVPRGDGGGGGHLYPAADPLPGDLRRHPRVHRQRRLAIGQVAAAAAADVRLAQSQEGRQHPGHPRRHL